MAVVLKNDLNHFGMTEFLNSLCIWCRHSYIQDELRNWNGLYLKFDNR